MAAARGFIVATWEEHRRSRRGEPRILATGRLGDGRSFAAVLPPLSPSVFVAPADAASAILALARVPGACADPEPWTELSGAPRVRISLGPGWLDAAEERLAARGIEVKNRDRPRASSALLLAGVSGPVAIEGRAVRGRRVETVFLEPRLSPIPDPVPLRWVALDIETDRTGRVVAASLAGGGQPGEVIFLGDALPSSEVTAVPDERALLSRLAERIRARDPDVLTGWNVVDFDLRVLAGRYAALGLRFDVGRTPEGAVFREREGRRAVVAVPGRAVIDALRLVRASGERYEDQSLDAVARAVLGEGKTVALRGSAKLDELDRLRRDDPARFCAYCLRDSELVLEILSRLGLDELTARRAQLTGVSLDLAWTSIPAFERIYAAELRARRVVPPELAPSDVSGAAGGTVLEAAAGLFANVVVFDFRSLYPSLMRTFNIDPLAHARAQAHPQPGDIAAPNGARFERSPGILPAIITRYATLREAALAGGDATAAYVYKILQNSFYGVLGAGGCRYASTALAGAITSFGKLFLTAARDWFEARGHRVLYGDTDSLFVVTPLGDSAGAEELSAFGEAQAASLNQHLSERILREYGLPSHLRIRCEKAYRRFLIPRLKGDTGSDARGRAKGYAGLKLGPGGKEEIEVRGMEAVRTDFTPLARRFQVELLSRVFAGAGPEEMAAFCRALVEGLRRGELDAELVYRKSLRRPASEYASATPQVRAARLLGMEERGRVAYVITSAGAEPTDARSGAPLDYAHYLGHQLLPIAQAVADVLGANADAWFGLASQLPLFPLPNPAP